MKCEPREMSSNSTPSTASRPNHQSSSYSYLPINETGQNTSSQSIARSDTVYYGSISETEEPKMESMYSSDRIPSLLIIALCVLLGDISRGLLFPTLYLYVKSLGGDSVHLGYAVACFSMGRVVSSPIFGYLSELYGYRYVLMVCNSILFMGACLYASANGLHFVFAAQSIMGFGAGSLGVTRSYVAESTPRSHRAEFMAYLTSVQYSAFAVTPVLGSILAALGESPPPSSSSSFAARNQDLTLSANPSANCSLGVSPFALPAYFLASLSLLCTILLAVLFKEIPRDRKHSVEIENIERDDAFKDSPEEMGMKKGRSFESMEIDAEKSLKSRALDIHSRNVQNASTEVSNGNGLGLLTPQTAMVIGGCLLNVVTKGTMGVFETLGSEFVVTHFSWSIARTGLTFAVFGGLGVACLLSFRLILRIFGDVNLIIYGIMIMALSCLLLFRLFRNTVHEFQFYSSLLLMYAVGYPVGHTAVLGVVSKIVKSGPQGSILGWFGAAGSLARIVFPLVAGYVTKKFDDSFIFAVMAFVLGVTNFIVLFFRSRIEDILHD